MLCVSVFAFLGDSHVCLLSANNETGVGRLPLPDIFEEMASSTAKANAVEQRFELNDGFYLSSWSNNLFSFLFFFLMFCVVCVNIRFLGVTKCVTAALVTTQHLDLTSLSASLLVFVLLPPLPPSGFLA